MPRFDIQAGKRWLAVRTKARCEKKLHAWCERVGLNAYLPLRRSIRRYPHRVVQFTIPIFRGYLFVQAPIMERGALDESRYVAHILVPDDRMEVQLIAELNELWRLAAATEAGELVVRPEIVEGQAITIERGPLAGLRGVVQRRKQQTRLAVNVEMIGQSVSVDLDVDEVEIDS